MLEISPLSSSRFGACCSAAAIALAPAPRVLVADEPETGLDPVLRRSVLELLARRCVEHGAALVLITHDRDALERFADDVVELGGPERAVGEPAC